MYLRLSFGLMHFQWMWPLALPESRSEFPGCVEFDEFQCVWPTFWRLLAELKRNRVDVIEENSLSSWSETIEIIEFVSKYWLATIRNNCFSLGKYAAFISFYSRELGELFAVVRSPPLDLSFFRSFRVKDLEPRVDSSTMNLCGTSVAEGELLANQLEFFFLLYEFIEFYGV